MKILLLINSLESGGMQRRMIELIKGLNQYPDVQLKLIVFSEKIHYQEVYELGIPVTILKRVPKRNPLVFYRLYKLCKKWRPDLIHSWGTMAAIFAIPSCLLLNIKLINGSVVNATRNMDFFDPRLFRTRLTFPFSSVIVGNSKAGLEAFKVPERRGICIYNGIDLQRRSILKGSSEIREQFNIKTNKIVGMVGVFSYRKDFKTYIEAALMLLNQRKDVTFLAVGDGPNLAKSKEMIPPDHASNFIFTGVQRDVESIVNILDIGVLSTNISQHEEGISNAILEYMLFEKPVLATAGGGTNEVVIDKKTGILIPADSPELMAEKINYLLDNPEESRAMGMAGRKRLDTTFSLEKMTGSYYSLYQRILS